MGALTLNLPSNLTDSTEKLIPIAGFDVAESLIDWEE